MSPLKRGSVRSAIGRVVRTVWRTVWRTAVTLCFIIGLTAVLLLAGVAFLSWRGAPERLLARVRSEAARHGLSLDLRSAVWRPWFTLRVDALSAWPAAAPEIRLSARGVDLDFAADLSAAPAAELRQVAFSGAHLLCPPPAGETNVPPLDLRDAGGRVTFEPGHVSVSADGRLAGLADLSVSGRLRLPDRASPVAGPPREVLPGEQLAAGLRRVAVIQGRVREALNDLTFDRPPSVRVELLPGDAAGGVRGVRVLAEGGEGRWRSIPFDRWSADVAWSAPGRLEVRRLEVRLADGRLDAEGDVDLASGRFTARAAGTLLPSLVATLLPASSNAAPWLALAEGHPRGRAEGVASGVTTNLRAAVWSLAWRTDDETGAAPLVVHRAALEGSNGVVRVRSADVSCRDAAAVLPDAWRGRMEALDLAIEGSVRARLTSPVDVLPAEAKRALRAHVEADCMRWRGITLRNGRAAFESAGGVTRVRLLDAGIDAPWRDGRLDAEVEYAAANRATYVRAHFRGDPASLFPALPEGPREGLRVLRFEDPATVDASCRVNGSTSTVWRVDVHVAASRMKVREEAVEALNLSLEIEPGRVRAPQMNMVIGGGLVGGTWDYDWNAKVLRLDARSSAEPHAVLRAASPQLDARLAELKAGGPVWVTLAGAIPFGPAAGGLSLRGDVVGEGVGWERFVAQRARAILEIDSTNVAVTVSDAQWCSGTLSGHVKVPMERGLPCSMSWQVTDASSPQVSRLLGRDLDEKRDAGLLSCDFRLTGQLGTNFLATATGSGSARLRNGYVMSMPLFGGLSAYLSVLIPGFGYAEQREARADFAIGNNAVTTDNGRLLGRLVSIGLRGSYRFDGRLDFRVEVLFLKEGLTATVTRLITAPLTKALEFELTGTFEKPEWWPVNTPTRLLNFFKRQINWIPGVSFGEPAGEDDASVP